MASLALKAISYGAERIPDKFFDSLPGGYFRSQEEKERKKRRKREKERHKQRTQSEGRGRRRRSPSHDESDDYTDDYYTEDSDFERRRRSRRRSSDAERGRNRDRERKHRHHQHHKDRSWSRGHDHHGAPPKADRSRSIGLQQHPYISPPPVQPVAGVPPIHMAGENYAHPQPYNAAQNHYTAKPYNPADYAPGALHTAEYSNGQPTPMVPQASAQASPATQITNGGYYGTQFPPPPAGSRSSRGSSVDSRGMQPGTYIPHSNIQVASPPTATAGAPGYSPYGTNFHSAANTPPYHTPPQYRPQNSSPYQPNYSPTYPPQQPKAHGSQPVSRRGSVHNGSAHGGQVGDHRHSHPRHRRHSISTNQDHRMLYRSPYQSTADSSATSRSTSLRSLRNSLAEAIQEVSGQTDGIDESNRPVAVVAPASTFGTLIDAATAGVSTAEALDGRHQARSGRRFHGGRRAMRSAPVDGFESS